MGFTGVASVDLWSANNNQAALAFYEPQGAAGFYYQNSFMIKELGLSAGAAAIPTKSGVFGFSINNFGYNNFNTKKIGLAYGKTLAKNFAVGVQLDYLNMFLADNYGNRSMFTFELGLLAKVTDEINIGAHVFNPIRVKLANYNEERLPLAMNLGMQWKASDNFMLSAEVESDILNRAVFKFGLEYMITDMIYARAGISNNPNIFTFGAGLHIANFRLDFSSSMHQILGYSPQFSLIYDMDK